MHEPALNIIFRDVFMLALLSFLGVIFIMLPYINDPSESAGETTAPGNVIIHVSWQDGIDCDVDLWVLAPTDARPVGYSNKHGKVFDLTRDDLGNAADSGKANFEFAYSRGIPSGEYVANLHLYRCVAPMPIPVNVTVDIKEPRSARPNNIYAGRVELQHVGQEITVVRFKVDRDGRFVTGSDYSLFKPLRAATGAAP